MLDANSGRMLADVRKGLEKRTYSPGSTAKLITAYAGLSTGAIKSSTTFHCKNVFSIDGRVFHCTKPGGHGALNLQRAISSSCNIWFYQAARKIGRQRIASAWRHFGVSVEKGKYSAERLAIGEEGVQVTAQQMAKIASEISIHRNKSGTPYPALAESMRAVVTQGTAADLAKSKAKVAGKTGSPAHYLDQDLRHGWFIGFVPYNKPEYAFAVFCLEGNSYRSAVPVTRKIMNGLYESR